MINMSLAGTSFTRVAGARARGGLLQRRAARWRPPATTARTATRSSSPPPLSAAAGAAAASACRWRPRGRTARAPRFSTHNAFVSLAAPGASAGELRASACSRRCRPPTTPPWTTRAAARGSSPASAARTTPTARARASPRRSSSGLAALAWQAEPRLASEQVARRAHRARPAGARLERVHRRRAWPTAMRAVEIARVYDVLRPARARRARTGDGNRVRVRVERARATGPRAGDELAGHVTYGLLVSRDGGSSFHVLASRRRRPFTQGRADPRPPRERAREHRLRRERQLRRQAARPLPPALAEPGLQVAHRVDGRPVDAHLEVEVRAEAVAGAADCSRSPGPG